MKGPIGVIILNEKVNPFFGQTVTNKDDTTQ